MKRTANRLGNRFAKRAAMRLAKPAAWLAVERLAKRGLKRELSDAGEPRPDPTCPVLNPSQTRPLITPEDRTSETARTLLRESENVAHAKRKRPTGGDGVSREQIDAALKTANKVREERAELRARVRPLDPVDGRYELAAILDEDGHDMALARVPIVGFLKWSKRMLPEMIRRYLAEADCTEFKMIGQMSGRQRRVMAAALRLPLAEMRERDRERALDRAALVWADARNREAAA